MMKALRRLAYWLRSRREDAYLREELEFHRIQVQQQLEAGGATPSDAALQSRRAMGNMLLAREDARDAWAIRAVDVLWRDVRCGLRALRKEPTFAITAIATLAIGVATTTMVFSVVDAELWKPLPFRDPARLVEVYSAAGTAGMYDSISGADFLDWKAGTPAFQDLAGYAGGGRHALQRDVSELVITTDVTWNVFELFGRRPIAGRTFAPDDATAGAVVLTDRAWRRLFDADPSLVGGSLRLDGRPVRVVGIVAAVDIDGPDCDVYVPIDETAAAFRDRGQQTLTSVVGRLRPGATIAEAQAQLGAVADRLARAYPAGRQGHAVHVQDYQAYYARFDARPLYFFLAASAFVLLLTCVNVAGLLLARALKRRSEFAIRGALGGGAAALLRQLVVEGFCLAMPAAVAAILFSGWGVAALAASVPPDYLFRTSALAVDWRVCAFAVAVCAATAIVFGFAPALAARRIDLSSTLGDGARTAGSTPAQSRARTWLLSAQVAFTIVLLAAAGLFLKSYTALSHVPVGFDPAGRVSLGVSSLSGDRYKDERAKIAYTEAVRQRVAAIPGVQQVVIASTSPLTSGPILRFTAGEHPVSPGNEPRAIIRASSPGFFSALGIRVLQGRDFTESDTSAAPRVAVVNEVLARRFFPGQNPIGRTLDVLPGQRTPWTRRPGQLTIVGVAGNAKEVGLNEIEFSDIYVPFAQMPAPSLEVIAQTNLPLSAVAAPLRTAVAQIDPAIPLGRVRPLDARIDDALRQDRFHLAMIGGFAGIALLLAAMGIYGAVAYANEQRRREFGVRLALGAEARQLVLMSVGGALRVAALGAAAGLAIAIVLAKLIGSALYLVAGVHQGLLFGVSTSDPEVLLGAVVVLILIALTASAIPARRVAWIDPVASLRQQ